jgi:outer membrane protein OmpA-like peptidoglycan-associated protein/tetratricopeptide (TPR) repeat protein
MMIVLNFKELRIVLTLVIGFFSMLTQAQVIMPDLPFDAKRFPGREKECAEAVKQIETGDAYFMKGPAYFGEALQYYLKAQEFNTHNADLNYQIGLCYLNMSKDRLKALLFFERALQLKTDMGNDFLFDLGIAYQYSLEFEKAVKVFTAYLTAVGPDAKPALLKKVNKVIKECESGMELVKKPIRVRIENLGPNINSKFADYAPVLSEDETKIMFTSRREGTTGNLVDPVDSMYLEDIYLSYKLDSEWAPAKNAGSPINSTEHDGTINLSPDGKRLIIYRTVGGGDIFESTMNGISWSEPRPLTEINSKDYENHAAYSIDGKTLFFVSNRSDKQAQGSKDIYLADVAVDGTISSIRNAGPIINTLYEEDGVFCHPDGKSIFFSSRGHNTMGGFDIFKTTFENGEFSAPVNVGYPINSPEDDVFFILSKDGKRGYFASYREEGYGEKDIYVMNFLEEVEALASIQVSIVDTLKKEKIKALVEITDASGTIIMSRMAENGETMANVPAGKLYTLKVSADPYYPYEENLNIPFEASNQIIRRTVELSTEAPSLVSGIIVDNTTRIPLQGEIEIHDLLTGEIIKTANSAKDGSYNVKLPADKKYQLQTRSLDYRTYTDTLRIDKGMEGKDMQIDYGLKKLDRVNVIALKGTIKDSESGKLLNAEVVITEYGGIPLIVYSKDGNYDAVVSNGATYTITVEKEGYLSYTNRVEIPDSTYGRDVILDINLLKAEKGSRMVLKNIFFDFNKSTLRPESYASLRLLLAAMKNYPTMQIEVSGHTDNVGSLNYNQVLSESRAAVVKEYLIQNGIASKRIISVGKSFKQPIASNETDQGRQLNRRTEIKIISME